MKRSWVAEGNREFLAIPTAPLLFHEISSYILGNLMLFDEENDVIKVASSRNSS